VYRKACSSCSSCLINLFEHPGETELQNEQNLANCYIPASRKDFLFAFYISKISKPEIMSKEKQRCAWGQSPEIYQRYHDEEWGVPLHDDRRLFEMLILEGAQAGLSWLTVLQKRDNYRLAFDNFDPQKVANYTETKITTLLQNPGIIRNRLKVNAAVVNAQCYLEVVQAFGSFDKYIWQFVGGKPIVNHFRTMKEVPAFTAESEAMSKDLKRRGFKFVGSTICYAYMQATGMVDDHVADCWKRGE
jgi:DNA-3-methyladenine glycosylase I